MRRDSLRLLLLAGAIALAVLYGMELSSRGIARVYGPMENPDSPRTSATYSQGSSRTPSAAAEDWTLPPRKSSPNPIVQDREIQIPRNDRQPLVDRVSAAAAETLYGISSGGIRFVVSLFDKVTGS